MQTLIQQTVSGHDALLWNKWAPFWVRFQDQNLATKSVQPYLSEHPLCKHVEPSAFPVVVVRELTCIVNLHSWEFGVDGFRRAFWYKY